MADAEHVYPAGDNLYWLSIENEAGLFHVADGIGTLKCRLLFDNYNMNLVTRGKRIIPLNDSLVLVSAMQGTLLVNIRELIGNSLGSTPLKVSGLEYVDASGIHHLPINTQRISLPHNFQEFNVWAGTTIFTSNQPDQLQDRRRIFRLVRPGNTTGKSLSCNCRKGGMN